MSFISVFDVLGPNMIGPSSSHTAGAAVIAYLAHKMIAPPLKKVDFTLYGSFAKTYHGHGTDRALLGGIMGFSTDDTRIRNSFSIATERGLSYSFTPCETETDVHPNTVDIRMENVAGQVMTVIPGEGPCYRCIFRDLPAAGEIPTCKEAGVLGAVVGVIGSLEATEAVKLIAGVGEPLVARMLTVDALTMNIRRVPLPKHVPDCPVCGEQPTITAIDPANYIQPACAI